VTLVVDASTVAEGLTGSGQFETWAESLLKSEALAAPQLMPAEVTSVLRNGTLAGRIPLDVATLAYGELLSLPVVLFSYAPYAPRIWELRANITPYDAWYVALAEALNAPLATADARLVRASGPRCRFVTPPA
jgi:predicted nucleic acid-binding protein